MKSHFGLFRNSVSFSARYLNGLRLLHQSKKPFWTHYLVLLGEEAQVEAWFGQFGDSADPYAREVHGLHGTYHMLGNQFGCTLWNSLMMCVIWNLALSHLETLLVSVQDRCIGCT